MFSVFRKEWILLTLQHLLIHPVTKSRFCSIIFSSIIEGKVSSAKHITLAALAPGSVWRYADMFTRVCGHVHGVKACTRFCTSLRLWTQYDTQLRSNSTHTRKTETEPQTTRLYKRSWTNFTKESADKSLVWLFDWNQWDKDSHGWLTCSMTADKSRVWLFDWNQWDKDLTWVVRLTCNMTELSADRSLVWLFDWNQWDRLT